MLDASFPFPMNTFSPRLSDYKHVFLCVDLLLAWLLHRNIHVDWELDQHVACHVSSEALLQARRPAESYGHIVDGTDL